MKKNKKALLEILKKGMKKDSKFESLVVNIALQKIDGDTFEYDGEAVYTADHTRLVYCTSNNANFTIPEGVKVIGEMAFRAKKSLKNVIIANSVEEIESDAFYDCDMLENVYVPAGVMKIKGYAFAECDSLKHVTFAGVPSKLSHHTFDDCDMLHEIIVPNGEGKTFRNALHYIEGDSDVIIVEMPKNKKETKKNTAQQKDAPKHSEPKKEEAPKHSEPKKEEAPKSNQKKSKPADNAPKEQTK